MRSFVAIDLTEETKAAFAPLQRAYPFGRPVLPENMHLTLAFLDDQPEETLEAMHEELLTLAVRPFSITFAGIECYGRALTVRAADCSPLTALHRKVQTAARRAGIILPRRRFRPHVTIARFKPEQRETIEHASRPCIISALPEMLVANFTLFQSTLRPEGPLHDALAHYPFKLTTC
ncbi:RNA 2',3'-cyclic phosphodiesterase [Ruegeria sp. Ofav3-42]|uniref:RNA 2',3'-cyclic phosphodiesterase n=1 Tax=Ruegeria sp. Ofav3-42 TaxID=2917759 RepID=UPI001EF6DA06|nr:RNA 2',3'-cyclic phosphodiesterase [Ruegeria sp. Ofav3-42]MCG7522633.1 RNA 2',3'-cyclic phosphodiesterase [Ruegeria sp. Ofav3-42]